jgi:outer membrane protein
MLAKAFETIVVLCNKCNESDDRMNVMTMNQRILLGMCGAGLVLAVSTANAQNLLDTYQQALQHDQTYANAVATAKGTAEGSPQALSALLPQISGTGSLAWAKSYTAGTSTTASSNTSTKTRAYGLTLTQQIFNFTDWLALGSARNATKAAYATLSYAKQTLMSSTVTAYLKVLNDEDSLKYDKALKNAVYEQYYQAQESFNVGTKTIIDVDQAKAAYNGAIATVITAQNQLNSDVEALSVITGQLDTSLTPLAKNIPLVSPNPKNVQPWIQDAVTHNWKITADRFTVSADKDSVKSEWGGHLPSLNAQGTYTNSAAFASASNSNPSTRSTTGTLSLTVPIFSGFDVTSQVRQAIAQEDADQATLDLDQRTEMEAVRTSYAGIGYDIALIKASYATVLADRNSVNSTIEGYKVGTQTMTDVLTAEQKLYQDLQSYAGSRYQYLNDAIALKQAAGTLSTTDIASMNSWMSYPKTTPTRPTKPHKTAKH